MLTKTEVHQACEQQLQERINRLAQEMQALKDAYGEETKSSAGDKYETSREMIQAEREKLAASLEDARQQMARLTSLAPDKVHDTVQSGSLVETMQGWYYVSAGIGKVQDLEMEVFALSPASPVAREMLGKQAGDTFEWNKQTQTILSIY